MDSKKKYKVIAKDYIERSHTKKLSVWLLFLTFFSRNYLEQLIKKNLIELQLYQI